MLVLGNVEFVEASAVQRDLLVPSAQNNTARRWRNFIGEHNTVDEQSDNPLEPLMALSRNCADRCINLCRVGKRSQLGQFEIHHRHLKDGLLSHLPGQLAGKS